jgi:pimeloyl-ACP methyl ester carboxylesterase
MADDSTRLDPREQHFRVASAHSGRKLFLRYLPAAHPAQAERRHVLYVHGATFPSALSVACRFDGRSWRDALHDAGFDVWAFDFLGFGHSDRYPEMDEPATAHRPLCDAKDGGDQVTAVVRFILGHARSERISVVSHSWGSMPAGRFAGQHPEQVDRWVLFGPIARRPPRRYETAPSAPAWRVVTVEDQWRRFIEDVPPQAEPVLLKRHFAEWGERYLDSDPASRTRDPAGVKVPTGPFADILRAWHGDLGYDPALVRAPIAIMRGEWDGLVTDEDARWLFDAFTASPMKRDIKIGRATHLMHLERMRAALWRETNNFLLGHDETEPT